ncbi:hypothetical protein AGMMS5026_10850 [Endomicrobiia bacterium]|nr:hypothetical protein AGMMS49571_11000 [Endomicrobiia bacterium]GHT21764.1 hypothetical protein AGMMS49929_10700 [Endomicrobiia bacterium]GHT32601.1 hypothetical protein AGMMS5026_10850 [Endomicrobiia bacterium]
MKNKKEFDCCGNDMRHTAEAPKLEKRLKKSLNVFGLVLLTAYLFGLLLLTSCSRVNNGRQELLDEVCRLKHIVMKLEGEGKVGSAIVL